MLKKVVMYINPKEVNCDEIKKYLGELEISLQVRDINEKPLNLGELLDLLKHYELSNFLETTSSAYKKNQLDKSMPERHKVIELIAADNGLLRMPILVYGRLMTVGCNQDKITEMLQLKNNGDNSDMEERHQSEKNTRRAKK